MKCTNKQCIFELTPVSKSLIFAFKHEKWILNCQKLHNVKLRSLDYQTPRKSVEKEKFNFITKKSLGWTLSKSLATELVLKLTFSAFKNVYV